MKLTDEQVDELSLIGNEYIIESFNDEYFFAGKGVLEIIKKYEEMKLKSSQQEKKSYICPVTKTQCDDECCVSPEHCNIDNNEIGYPVSEDCEEVKNWDSFVEQKNKELDMIDFAKWLAIDWMSIWVEDKWMWEYQKVVSTYHPYFGYLTEEQLYKMYLVDKKN